ncbi:chemotaxis protein CheR [Allostella sp. ATCC 35155]|nr:chemotaxis protein CheR [Stella sp. ATCC 35155]
MEGLFKGMPDDPGAAFVIVTHLSPEHESRLHEVVGRYTGMPAIVAEEGARVAPNCVYVMPPGAILTIAEGCLRLRRANATNRERKPIDIFLSALAEDQGEYAVAVILSGGDGDGTLGVKAVKERGGFTLAQTGDGTGPRNRDMPESAISSGMIDVAAPVEQMGGKIAAFARSFGTLAGLAEDDGEREEAELRQARRDIYGILRTQSGHDFAGYKTKTFLRRVRRRMQILQMESISGYVDLLKRDAAEAKNLFRDLLINVTNFFRDPDAFAVLETLVVPRLFENRAPHDTVRVWVPGCATGEEVYSIAILMREQLDKLATPPRVQIFATDIDEPALAVARAGRYPEQLLEGVSPARRERFFANDGVSYVIAAEARELCIFSPHNVIRDPPFSRMDLVSCRNLLIYFGQDIQNRVLPTFHYALKPSGYLFLGISESIGQHSALFATIDKKNRIFQAREHARGMVRLPPFVGDPRTEGRSGPEPTPDRLASYPLRQAVEAQVLERFSPPHVVVNAEGDIVYYSARTGRYLEAPQGAPSRQILTLARKGLRLDLRAALREAVSTQSTIVRDKVVLDEESDRIQPVRLTIEPVPDRGTGESLYLILFEPLGPAQDRADGGQEPTADGTAELERELRDTRERLQATIEEYETALEELKSANEELVSVNEEGQSTNEELEASKEEMQSLNEELNTINTELTGKVDELDRANADLKNLFESTQIATVFLDRNLVIRNFTPAASAFFNLRSADIGRPLTDLSSKLDYPELKEHIAAVFATGEMVEHQLRRNGDGKHYLVRLIPYRVAAGRTDGVVVTLVDVTTLAEAEEHQQVLISELNHRVKNMLAVVISVANHTLRKAPTPKDFTESLTGRLHAMARAYRLLSRTNWKEASVAELVQQETDGFDAKRFHASGPDVRLPPQQGLSIAMVLHELATNASKYGALSQQMGSVNIRWDVAEGRFQLDWEEENGPPVTPPERDGFGLALVKGEIGYRLGGEVTPHFDPKGLRLQMSFALPR